MDSDAPAGSQTSVETDASAPAGHVAIEMELQVPPTPARETFAELNMPNYPYHERMRKLLWRSRSHEDLMSLVERTERLIHPDYRIREENLRKRSKTNVTIVEHMPNTKPTFISVDKVEDLRSALATESRASRNLHGNDQPAMRLYIVEDLSTDVVELLGSRYNIDPLFFSTQYDFQGHQDGGLFEASRLQVSKKRRKWFHIDNVRMCRREQQVSRLESEDANTRNFNVNRDLESHHAGREYFSTLSTRTAFWLEKDGEGGPLIGIVLVDPTTSALREDNRDKSIPRPTTKSEAEKLPTPSTWFSDIVEISSRFLGNQPFPLGTATTLMAVVYPATIAVCAEWLKVCHYCSVILDRVEHAFVSLSHSAPMREKIDEALETLTRLSQYLPSWRRMVVATLDDAVPAAMRLIQPASHPEEKQDNLLLDQIGPNLKRILRNIEELQTQVTRLTERGVAEMQLQAARESLAESHNLARLSWLATIFVPLTFLSGLFSMDGDIGSLKVSFKHYFRIGIPLVVGVLVVVRWGPNVTHGMVECLRGAKISRNAVETIGAISGIAVAIMSGIGRIAVSLVNFLTAGFWTSEVEIWTVSLFRNAATDERITVSRWFLHMQLAYQSTPDLQIPLMSHDISSVSEDKRAVIYADWVAGDRSRIAITRETFELLARDPIHANPPAIETLEAANVQVEYVHVANAQVGDDGVAHAQVENVDVEYAGVGTVEGSNVELETHGVDVDNADVDDTDVDNAEVTNAEVEEAPLARTRDTSSAATDGVDLEWAPLAGSRGTSPPAMDGVEVEEDPSAGIGDTSSAAMGGVGVSGGHQPGGTQWTREMGGGLHNSMNIGRESFKILQELQLHVASRLSRIGQTLCGSGGCSLKRSQAGLWRFRWGGAAFDLVDPPDTVFYGMPIWTTEWNWAMSQVYAGYDRLPPVPRMFQAVPVPRLPLNDIGRNSLRWAYVSLFNRLKHGGLKAFNAITQQSMKCLSDILRAPEFDVERASRVNALLSRWVLSPDCRVLDVTTANSMLSQGEIDRIVASQRDPNSHEDDPGVAPSARLQQFRRVDFLRDQLVESLVVPDRRWGKA